MTQDQLRQKLIDEFYSALDESGLLDRDIVMYYSKAIVQLNTLLNITSTLNTTFCYGIDTGTADNYAISVSNVSNYQEGSVYLVKPIHDNIGTSTLNINNMGVKTIKKNLSSDLESGDIVTGQPFLVMYDGTNFQFIGGGNSTRGIEIIPAATDSTIGGVIVSTGLSVDVDGTLSVTVPYTTDEQTKLSGIETGANNYTLPSSLSPSIITQDTSNRFVSDTEKSTWNGKASGSHGHSASEITSGTLDIQRIPQSVLERLVIVADQTARYALTTTTVQNGDVVKQTSTNDLWYVKDDAHLDGSSGYEQYTTTTASAVPWSGVTDKPSTFTPSTHSHDNATTLVSGFMSTSDKTKLDGLSSGPTSTAGSDIFLYTNSWGGL